MDKSILRTALAMLSSLVIIAGLVWLLKIITMIPDPLQPVTSDHLSVGDEILAKDEAVDAKNPEEFTGIKQRGVEAFSKGEYDQAVREFQQALQSYKNAPETLIYLSNARIGTQKSYEIAVSIPLDDKEPNALAILRGVAQAQNEVNEAGGINGIPLKVLIADDNNDENTAKEIASKLAKDSNVLGVIGHFSSGTTLEAKKIYDVERLPLVSGSSTAVDLSEKDYVFRTVPSDAYTSEALANYMLKETGGKKVAVFFDSKSSYSRSLASTFIKETALGDGRIVEQFDFSKPGFNASDNVKQAMKSNAEVLMLAAHGGVLEKIYEVVRANNGKLRLLGGDELYNIEVLKNVGEQALGMVVGVAWDISVKPDPENQDTDFVNRTLALWGAQVNWHTAMTYDAAISFIEALKRNPSRSGIYEAFSDPGFSAPGASYPIRFTSEGDRFGKIYLLEIKKHNLSDRFDSGTGYDFVPVN